MSPEFAQMDRSDEPLPDPQLEELLRRCTPTPTTTFEALLERDLFSAADRRARRRRFAGLAAISGGLAATVVVASLAGSGPLASNGGSTARAKPGCTVVYVTKVEPVGQVVRRADGTVTVETNRRPVFHQEQRCR